MPRGWGVGRRCARRIVLVRVQNYILCASCLAATLLALLVVVVSIPLLLLRCPGTHHTSLQVKCGDARDARQGLFARLSARMGFSGGGAHSGSGFHFPAAKK